MIKACHQCLHARRGGFVMNLGVPTWYAGKNMTTEFMDYKTAALFSLSVCGKPANKLKTPILASKGHHFDLLCMEEQNVTAQGVSEQTCKVWVWLLKSSCNVLHLIPLPQLKRNRCRVGFLAIGRCGAPRQWPAL